MNDFQTELQIIVEGLISGGIILIVKLILIALAGFWPILFLVTLIRDWKKKIKDDAYQEGYNKGVEKVTDIEKNKTKSSDVRDYNKGFRDAVIRMKDKGQSKKKL